MFYSHDILHRRGGKFGIVWLAATKFTSVSLSKREYFTVSVSKTCDDIMKYICLQARPLKPHGAPPRLSLYLSSQLMFGVTRVYKKQMDYLNAEVFELYTRFLSTKLAAPLTSDKKDFMQVVVQKQYRTGKFCTIDDLLRDSDDSAFGVMKWGREIDPSCLPHIDFLTEESSPPGSSPPGISPPGFPPGFPPGSPPGFPPGFPPSDDSFSPPKMGDVRVPHTVASAAEISLKEFPELPELPNLDDYELMPVEEPGDLIAQMERAATEPTFEYEDLRPEEQPPVLSPPREKGAKSRKEKKPTEKKTAAVAPPDDVTVGSPLQERPVIPPEPVTPTAPTPIPVLHLSPLDELPEVTSPRRHGRRRQLSFHDVVDDYTQLSKLYIRNNMATSNDLCYSSAYECLASVPRPTTTELLQLSGRESLTKSKTLMDMWKRRAVRFRGPVVPSDDDDGEPWSTQYLRVKPDISSATETSPEVPRGSPEEMRALPRESSEKPPGLDDTTPSLLALSHVTDQSRLSDKDSSIQHQSLPLDPAALRPKRLTEQSIEEEQDIGLEQLLPVGSPPGVVPGPSEGPPEELLVIAAPPPEELPVIAAPPPEELPGIAEAPQEELPEIAVTPPEDLPGIAEEAKSPEISTSEEEQTITIPHQNIIMRIAELTSVDDIITFKDLVPLTSSCTVAGKVFSVCLEYAALKLIMLHQTISYGDIYIRRGELF